MSSRGSDSSINKQLADQKKETSNHDRLISSKHFDVVISSVQHQKELQDLRDEAWERTKEHKRSFSQTSFEDNLPQTKNVSKMDTNDIIEYFRDFQIEQDIKSEQSFRERQEKNTEGDKGEKWKKR